MGDKYLPQYISMFEQKLDDMKKRIQKELKKPKKERNPTVLHDLVKQAKRLQKTVKEAKKATGKQCPHCGKDL